MPEAFPYRVLVFHGQSAEPDFDVGFATPQEREAALPEFHETAKGVRDYPEGARIETKDET